MTVADRISVEPFEGMIFPEPAEVRLELRQADRMLAVQGSVEAKVRGQCDACLKDVDAMIHVDVNERLDPAHGRESDPLGESNVLTGERLDVADLAQQSVLSALPMGLRCGEDCKGLCAICGANRNIDQCGCEHAEQL